MCGYFRTFEAEVPGTLQGDQQSAISDQLSAESRKLKADGSSLGKAELRGYHKPIMLAGGLGNIRADHVKKGAINPGDKLVVLGGPAMLIGLGGGAASSIASGAGSEDLDFASVQRDNAEMQRRCQEVIDRCWALGDGNPIASIHDVGAGGLSNALPELVNDSNRGARFELRAVPSDEPGMSPLEIWCNEAQERYVMAVPAERLATFEALCRRERAPFAVLGQATDDGRLAVDDRQFGNRPIDVPLQVILGKPPRMRRTARHLPVAHEPFAAPEDLHDAALRVLRFPAVADKTFLITIGDRTVGGLVCRDQMVGRFQVPVADCAVTATSFDAVTGEAMAIGERTPVALLDAAAAARLAIGEAITNLAAAPIAALGRVVLSANWMVAAGHPGEDARLWDAVRAAGAELCPALGIAIPVGKDSMSMRTVWDAGDGKRSVTAPLSLVVSGFAPVTDVGRVLTPELRLDAGPTELVLVDLGRGRNRLGGSVLAQVYGALGDAPPDLDDPALLRGLFAAVQEANAAGLLLAYHDRSDGGLLATLAEMAFAAGCGLDIDFELGAAFSEELGAVVQVRAADVDALLAILARHGLAECSHRIGTPTRGDRLHIGGHGFAIHELRAAWSEVSWRMQALRDDPGCADEEHALRTDPANTGLTARLTFDPGAPAVHTGVRPEVAILREQGVNGQIEMAAAFDRAGFAAVDVHMTDILDGRVTLDRFRGLVACGGFSFGDVLGAGEGWAKSARYGAAARASLARFFARPDTFAL
ncbi:MAG TPA: phosphoribosylformylglycinamidine synthase, partial [Kofleriaceae bacterium]|nr:phosphoribosylformylglycinamidine synthase [Kofleriaceae bacterium]